MAGTATHPVVPDAIVAPESLTAASVVKTTEVSNIYNVFNLE